jgi:hypothetical protein
VTLALLAAAVMLWREKELIALRNVHVLANKPPLCSNYCMLQCWCV